MQLRRAPARGDCEGVYVWAIREGQYGSTRLNGLHMAQIARYPGPVHEGNGTDVYVIDERADEAQRAALNTLAKGDGVGPPFEIFAAVSGKRLDPIYASFEVKLDGIRSEAKIDGGRIYEAVITRVKNPVTGEEEELYLDKPSGFTSLRSELGMSIVGRARADGLSFDHDGQYAEYAEFEYSGP
jgi:hypothetical protein